MNSGQGSYVWRLTDVADIAVDRGYGRARTRFCRVSVVASPRGMVTQLDAEDSNAGEGLSAAVGPSAASAVNGLG
jgi:hypothetical protein